MGAYDIFEIVATGRGAHAGMPHLGRDPMPFAAHVINALQTIVARNIHPLEAGVVSVTQVHGGDTWNVIPQEVVLRGTVRTFEAAIQDLIERRMGEIVAGIAATFEMQATLRYERRYPATINSPEETGHALAAATALLGAANVDADPMPSMGSEDFAFMLQKKPRQDHTPAARCTAGMPYMELVKVLFVVTGRQPLLIDSNRDQRGWASSVSAWRWVASRP